MGDLGEELRLEQFWPLTELRQRIESRDRLVDLDETSGGPARYVRLERSGQKIGFITPLTHNFCESCNRIRLTCTGQLYQCLGRENEADLRRVMRENPRDDAPLIAAIHAALLHKPKGHNFDYSQGVGGMVPRHMSHTGG